jgi:hypothetical protein
MENFLYFVAGYFVGSLFTAGFLLIWMYRAMGE